MFISRFNRYFEKHAKITYFVLLVIIIATFVIFVTPGDPWGNGNGAITDYGTMYGKKLRVQQMQDEMNRATVAVWMQYPQFFGQDLSRQGAMLFNEALNRMRMTRAAHQRKLDKVSDDEIKSVIAKCEAFHQDGKFNLEAYTNFLNFLDTRMGILPAEFDQIVRDNIAIERLRESIIGAAQVTEDEVSSALAEYTLKLATFGIEAKDGQPSEEDIQKFFAERKNEIKLPETKNTQIARWDYANEAADFAPTAEAIKANYDANSKTLYAGKTLEESTEAITKRLKEEQARADARKKADALSRSFQTAIQGESAEARLARFQAEAAKAGAAVSASGLVSTQNTLAGFEGPQAALANAIRNQSKVGDITPMVIGGTYAAVAYVTEVLPTLLPAALPEVTDDAQLDPIRQIITETLNRERALKFFAEKIETPYNTFMAEVKAVTEDNSLDDQSKQMRLYALNQSIDQELIQPFYVPEARDFTLVTFRADAFTAKVPEFTDADLAAEYTKREAEFQKVEVRLGYIVIKTQGLEGEALSAKEARIAEAKQQLDGGANFLEVAAKYSEQTNYEEQNLTDLEDLAEPVKSAVTALEKDQISAILDVDGTKQIVKVLERRDGRTLAEVRGELKTQMQNAAARQLAEAAAAQLAAAAAEDYWKAVDQNAEGVDTSALLIAAAAKFPEAAVREYTDINAFLDSNIGYEVLQRVFTATLKSPVTSLISGTDAAYVAGLTKISEAHLSAPAEDAAAMRTLLRSYTQTIQMEAAQKRAQAAADSIAKALTENNGDFAAAAAGNVFETLPAFKLNDLTKQGNTVANDLNNKYDVSIFNVVDELASLTKAGSFLAPQRAQRRLSFGQGGQSLTLPIGYQLLYVAERVLPENTADSADERAAVKARLLDSKISQLWMDFMTQLEIESDTRLREGISFR